MHSITVLLVNCLYALVRKETPTLRLSSDLKLSFGFPCVLGVGGERLFLADLMLETQG